MFKPLSLHRATHLALSGLLAGVLVTTSCKSPEERVADHVARAEEYIANGQRKEAILEFMSALNVDPADAEISERVAHLMSRQGALETAARYFLEAYNLDPTRVGAAMHHAELIAWTQRERADRLVADALESSPDEPIVHRTVATLALIDQDLDAANAAAQKAIALDETDPESWALLGRVRLGSVSLAILSKSVPPDAVYQESIAAFSRADELRGGDVGVKLEQAKVLAAWQGHASEAIAAYDAAIELAKQQGDSEVRSFAAHALAEYGQKSGRPKLLERGLREVVAAAPNEIRTWRRLAEVSHRSVPGSGQWVFDQLLEQRPNDARAHRAYTNYLVSHDRAHDAIGHLERVLADGIDSPAMWDDLVRYRLQRGQMSEAQASLAKLEERAGDHPLTQRARARVAMAEGRNGKAVELLRSMPAAANSVEGQRLLALAELRRGNLDEAGAAIDRSVALSDEFAMPSMRLKARIHHAANEWRRAYDTFKEIGQHTVDLTASEKLMIARAMYERRRPKAARGVLEEILAGDDFHPMAAVEFARREGLRSPNAALDYLSAVRAREPGNYPVLEAVVTLYRQRGGSVEALAIVKEAVAAGHGGPRAMLLRAQLLADTGDLARAETDALRAFEAAPALPGAVDVLIRIYRGQDKLEAALRSFEEAEAAGVLHTGARRLLGRLYAEQGQFEQAQEMLEKVIADRPRMGGPKSDLAVVLVEQGVDLERAMDLAREGAKSQALDPTAAYAAGTAYYHNGLHEAALVEYRRAINLDLSGDKRLAPTLQYHLGLTLKALDRGAQAAAAFSTALEISPNFPEADEARRQLEETKQTS